MVQQDMRDIYFNWFDYLLKPTEIDLYLKSQSIHSIKIIFNQALKLIVIKIPEKEPNFIPSDFERNDAKYLNYYVLINKILCIRNWDIKYLINNVSPIFIYSLVDFLTLYSDKNLFDLPKINQISEPTSLFFAIYCNVLFIQLIIQDSFPKKDDRIYSFPIPEQLDQTLHANLNKKFIDQLILRKECIVTWLENALDYLSTSITSNDSDKQIIISRPDIGYFKIFDTYIYKNFVACRHDKSELYNFTSVITDSNFVTSLDLATIIQNINVILAKYYFYANNLDKCKAYLLQIKENNFVTDLKENKKKENDTVFGFPLNSIDSSEFLGYCLACGINDIEYKPSSKFLLNHSPLYSNNINFATLTSQEWVDILEKDLLFSIGNNDNETKFNLETYNYGLSICLDENVTTNSTVLPQDEFSPLCNEKIKILYTLKCTLNNTDLKTTTTSSMDWFLQEPYIEKTTYLFKIINNIMDTLIETQKYQLIISLLTKMKSSIMHLLSNVWLLLHKISPPKHQQINSEYQEHLQKFIDKFTKLKSVDSNTIEPFKINHFMVEIGDFIYKLINQILLLPKYEQDLQMDSAMIASEDKSFTSDNISVMQLKYQLINSQQPNVIKDIILKLTNTYHCDYNELIANPDLLNNNIPQYLLSTLLTLPAGIRRSYLHLLLAKARLYLHSQDFETSLTLLQACEQELVTFQETYKAANSQKDVSQVHTDPLLISSSRLCKLIRWEILLNHIQKQLLTCENMDNTNQKCTILTSKKFHNDVPTCELINQCKAFLTTISVSEKGFDVLNSDIVCWVNIYLLKFREDGFFTNFFLNPHIFFLNLAANLVNLKKELSTLSPYVKTTKHDSTYSSNAEKIPEMTKLTIKKFWELLNPIFMRVITNPKNDSSSQNLTSIFSGNNMGRSLTPPLNVTNNTANLPSNLFNLNQQASQFGANFNPAGNVNLQRFRRPLTTDDTFLHTGNFPNATYNNNFTRISSMIGTSMYPRVRPPINVIPMNPPPPPPSSAGVLNAQQTQNQNPFYYPKTAAGPSLMSLNTMPPPPPPNLSKNVYPPGNQWPNFMQSKGITMFTYFYKHMHLCEEKSFYTMLISALLKIYTLTKDELCFDMSYDFLEYWPSILLFSHYNVDMIEGALIECLNIALIHKLDIESKISYLRILGDIYYVDKRCQYALSFYCSYLELLLFNPQANTENLRSLHLRSDHVDRIMKCFSELGYYVECALISQVCYPDINPACYTKACQALDTVLANVTTSNHEGQNSSSMPLLDDDEIFTSDNENGDEITTNDNCPKKKLKSGEKFLKSASSDYLNSVNERKTFKLFWNLDLIQYIACKTESAASDTNNHQMNLINKIMINLIADTNFNIHNDASILNALTHCKETTLIKYLCTKFLVK